MPESRDRADEERARARLQEAVSSEFQIGVLVGHGGFADVFEAYDERLDRRVAIKVMRPDLYVTEQLVERFQLEARAIAGLRHPNVMEIYTVGERDGVAYFVMPLIEGESLEQRLSREGALDVSEARRILIDSAGALGAAHRSGTVHRDVKPDNILLEGEEARVLIADFGIAKALGEETSAFTTSGVFVGTPRYLSPEQASGDPHDHRSDIYSLGIVAFEMIAGEPPFVARSVQGLIAKHLTEPAPPLWTVRSDCPERLALVIDRCLAKDPGDRWESLAEMVAVLEGAAELPLVIASRPGPGEEGGGIAHPISGGGSADGVGLSPASFRRRAVSVGAVLVALIVVDLLVGLGGLSAWVSVGAVGYLAAQAGRLWRAGYDWPEMLGPAAGRAAETVGRGAEGGTSGDGAGAAHERRDFGRFGSLVQASTADRATIVRSFGQLPRQEQGQFPALRGTVELLAGRVKHLALKVGTLEERIAEAASRGERHREAGPGPDAQLAGASLQRYAARLEELNSARDEAAGELRVCVSYLEELRDALTEQARTDPAEAMEQLARTLAEASAHVGERSL